MRVRFFPAWIKYGIPVWLSVLSASAAQITHEPNPTDSSMQIQEIKIGLLLPDQPEKNPLSLAAFQGAALAVKQANLSGGFHGKSIRLIVRTTNGLWGAGSKEAVKFIYDDEVCAILSAVDGRNAHLAEQVAAKAQVVQLATRAMDETLSQAYVPWFFRIVPNDKQQANAFIKNILSDFKDSKVWVFYQDAYDHKMAAETFRKEANKNNLDLPGIYTFSDFEKQIGAIEQGNEKSIILLFGSYRAGSHIFDALDMSDPKFQIYGSMPMTTDPDFVEGDRVNTEGTIFVTSNYCFTTKGQEFKKDFINQYKVPPNPASSYAFDGANLIIECVRKNGPEREGIRNYLSQIKYVNAATGTIEFDDQGNRTTEAFMVRIIKGHPVILNK